MEVYYFNFNLSSLYLVAILGRLITLILSGCNPFSTCYMDLFGKGAFTYTDFVLITCAGDLHLSL
jgi:hypothetical protein